MPGLLQRLLTVPASVIGGVVPVVNGGTGTTTSTGTGSTVLSTSPTLVTPILGIASGTQFTGTNTTVGGGTGTNDPVFKVARTIVGNGDGTGGTFSVSNHGFQDATTISITQNGSNGYAAFSGAMVIAISSGKSLPHVNVVEPTVTVTVTGAGTLSALTGVSINDVIPTGGGTLSFLSGFSCAALTGGTENWAYTVGNGGASGYTIPITPCYFGPAIFGLGSPRTVGVVGWNGTPVGSPLGLAAGQSMVQIHGAESIVGNSVFGNLVIGSLGVVTNSVGASPQGTGGVIDYGGSISLVGFSTASDVGNLSEYARIVGRKFNGTNGNSVGYCAIFLNDGTSGGVGSQTAFARIQALTITTTTIDMNAAQSLKLGQAASTTEGYIWYDVAAHLLKYRDNAGTKTVVAA